MISIGLAIVAVCSVIAWAYAALFTLLTAENRRFWKAHLRHSVPFSKNYPRTCVIIPCKGNEPNLKTNLQAFLQQDHPNYQVLFVVESRSDAAVVVIQDLIDRHPFVTARLIVAGHAMGCGQKVHNLSHAVDSLNAKVDVYAFADTDAAPSNTWLRWLVHCVGREGVGARTGYRWMKPKRNRLPTLLTCTINNAIAAMLGRGGHHLIWGGSWAIHRSIFQAAGIREVWTSVLSDDLAASRALRLSNLSIEFDPHCVCSSTVDYGWSGLFEFLRRQFVIAKFYTPYYWSAALLVTVATQVAFWGSLVIAVAANLTGATNWGLVFAASAAGLYASGSLRAAIRQNMGRKVGGLWRWERKARLFDLFAGPLTGLVASVTLLASVVGSHISWRGIHYLLGRGGSVKVLGRAIDKTAWPVQQSLPSQSVVSDSTPPNAVLPSEHRLGLFKTEAADQLQRMKAS